MNTQIQTADNDFPTSGSGESSKPTIVLVHGALESFDRIFKVNVLGVLLTTQAAAKHLKEGGSVINIGSSITSMTPPTMAVYAGSKAAVEIITKVLSKELRPKRIRVNCVLPGTTETEMFRNQLGGNVEQL